MRSRVVLLLLLASAAVLAHGPARGQSFGDFVVSSSELIVIAGAVVLALATLASIFWKKKSDKGKRFLFLAMVATVLLVTGYLVSATVYLNLTSWSGGPVHWHADFEVWVCGEQLHLPPPEGISNRFGSATVHEHGDDRMHLEGVIERREDASVGEFFETVGGHLEQGHLIFPTEHRLVEKRDGDACPSGRPGTLKFFVNNVSNSEFGEYVIQPFSLVPPGDSLRIVFGEE